MNVDQFNDKVVEAGKKIFGDRYKFSASHINSVMYGHIDKKEVKYSATIFYDDHVNISVESTSIDLMFEMLELEYKKLNAVQSSIEI